MVSFDVDHKESQMREYARQLRASLGILGSYAPIGMLAQARGISRVVEMRLGSDGFLARDGSDLVIYVNSQLGAARRRFTCAHEIGHTYVGAHAVGATSARLKNNSCEGCHTGFPRHDKEEEYLCDVFAAELLMPKESVEPLLSQYGVSVRCVQRIRLAFGVSLSAASWRMAELANENVGIIWFKRMGKPGNPADVKLRLDWGVFPHQERVYLPRYDSVRQESLVTKAFVSGQTVEGAEKLDLGSIRGTKFLHCRRFHNAVLCVVSDATSLPSYRGYCSEPLRL